MTEIRSHLQIILASIDAFANDGKLDADELRAMTAIAKKDGTVDVEEARALHRIIDKLTEAELTPEMKAAIADLLAGLPARA